MKFLAVILRNIYYRLLNTILHKRDLISDIEYEMRKIFLKNSQQFGGRFFYQSYPPLDIRGERSTLNRYKIYELDKFLNKRSTVLDIGGNVGFFSIFISGKVKKVDVVEINEPLTEIGKFLIEKEEINNVEIFTQDIMKLKSKEKYDIVFSFAVHHWVGVSFKEYLKKIHGLLKPNGLLLLESQDLKVDNIGDKVESIKDLYTVVNKGITDDHMGMKREYFYLRKR